MAKKAVEDAGVISYFLSQLAKYLKYILKEKVRITRNNKKIIKKITRWDTEDTGSYTHILLLKIPILFTVNNCYLFFLHKSWLFPEISLIYS